MDIFLLHMGQLPDVLDVVEEAMALNLFNTSTDNLNGEMDKADIKNLIAEEVEETSNTNKINDQSGDEKLETHT